MVVQFLKSLEDRLKQYVHLMEAESGLNHGCVTHIGSHLADLTEKANKVRRYNLCRHGHQCNEHDLQCIHPIWPPGHLRR